MTCGFEKKWYRAGSVMNETINDVRVRHESREAAEVEATQGKSSHPRPWTANREVSWYFLRELESVGKPSAAKGGVCSGDVPRLMRGNVF